MNNLPILQEAQRCPPSDATIFILHFRRAVEATSGEPRQGDAGVQPWCASCPAHNFDADAQRAANTQTAVGNGEEFHRSNVRRSVRRQRRSSYRTEQARPASLQPSGRLASSSAPSACLSTSSSTTGRTPSPLPPEYLRAGFESARRRHGTNSDGAQPGGRLSPLGGS